MFSRPMLIYDDRCSSCTKFAKTANTLSRGWIHIAGHYYSYEATEAKKIVFPADYDATKMFWLINKSGAYGARRGLIPVIKEIIIGLFRGKGTNQEIIDWIIISITLRLVNTEIKLRLANLLKTH